MRTSTDPIARPSTGSGRAGLHFRRLALAPLAAALLLTACAQAQWQQPPAGGWRAPSALPWLDLSGWKLQLPVDVTGGTGGEGGIARPAAEVRPAQLVSGFADAWFHAEGGEVVFTAPADGAVTTPGVGSDHTRAELRELYAGPGADAHGDWTSDRGGELRATCAVREVALRSDIATFAQIHGQERVFVLLVYRPGRRDVAVDLYDRNGSESGHRRTPIVTGVELGEPLRFALRYAGDALTVTVNGVTRELPVDRSWAGTPVYFKLGAYHAAPHTGNAAGDATQVACSALAVEHPAIAGAR